MRGTAQARPTPVSAVAPFAAFFLDLRNCRTDAKAQAARTLVSEHPVVTRHPETGEPMLFVSPSFLRNIVGLTPRENELLLEMLWEHATRAEYTVRFAWQNGDVRISIDLFV